MQATAIQIWLKRKAAGEALGSLLFALLCLAGGFVVLVVTFCFAYAIVWFTFNFGVSGFSELFLGRRLGLSHGAIVGVSVTFVGILFWGNARLSREYLGTFPKRRYPGPGLGWIGLPGALVSLLAYPGASTRMIADLLFTGPRLVMIAWSNATKSARLRRMDLDGCARVLAILMQRHSRFPFAEIPAVAALADPPGVFRQLRDIEGVVFLASDPPGLSLTDDLRIELRRAAGSATLLAEEEAIRAPQTPSREQSGLRDLLGVQAAASLEEIESAYRKRLRESTPEDLADWGRELQALVGEQPGAVNVAYDAFREQQREKERDESKGEKKKVERVWEQFRNTKE